MKEWCKYCFKLAEKAKTKHGDAVFFDDGIYEKSFTAHDFNGSGGVTKDELIWARKLKEKFHKDRAEELSKIPEKVP